MTDPAVFQRIAQLEVQVDWLRQLVDHLYQQLQVSPPTYRPPVATAPDAEIAAALATGNKITAIKLYREKTGVGLAEAKAAIDAMGGG